MLIVDTGFFYALADRDDAHHGRAAAALDQIKEPLITTWSVLTETTHLFNARLSARASALFLDTVASGFCAVHPLETAQLRRAAALMTKYANLPMDLADASLMLLAEHIDDGRILTTDRRDFKTYRFKNHKPFRNVLFPDD